MGKISVRADSVKEFREALTHGEGLGLSVKEVYFGGAWDSGDGDPVFLSGGTYEIEKVGHKYLHVHITGENGPEICPVEPGRSSVKDKGYVRVTFTD